MAKPKGKRVKFAIVPRPFKGKAPKGLIGKITGRK